MITFGNQLDLTVADYLVPGRRPASRSSRATSRGSGRATACASSLPRGARGSSARPWCCTGRPERGRRVRGRVHTASIAGDYAIYRALAERAGVMVADTLPEFGDLVRLALGLRDSRSTA